MNADNWWVNALWSIIPTVCLGLTFWFIIFSIIRADRSERRAYARIEAEERARLEFAKQNSDTFRLPQTELPDSLASAGVGASAAPDRIPLFRSGVRKHATDRAEKGVSSDGTG